MALVASALLAWLLHLRRRRQRLASMGGAYANLDSAASLKRHGSSLSRASVAGWEAQEDLEAALEEEVARLASILAAVKGGRRDGRGAASAARPPAASARRVLSVRPSGGAAADEEAADAAAAPSGKLGDSGSGDSPPADP